MATNPSIIKAHGIGCGVGGILRKITHYPSIEKIDMVQIDELVVKLPYKTAVPNTNLYKGAD